MGVKDSIVISKRQLKKVKPFELQKDESITFDCSDIILLPLRNSKSFGLFKNIDVVVCSNGEPLVRLVSESSDIIFLESSESEFCIDYTTKGGVFRIFPSINKDLLRLSWDGKNIKVGVV